MDFKISFFVGIFLMLLVSFAEGDQACPPGNMDVKSLILQGEIFTLCFRMYQALREGF